MKQYVRLRYTLSPGALEYYGYYAECNLAKCPYCIYPSYNIIMVEFEEWGDGLKKANDIEPSHFHKGDFIFDKVDEATYVALEVLSA